MTPNIAFRPLDSTGSWANGNLVPSPSRPGYSLIYLDDTNQFSMQPGGVAGIRDTSKGEGNGDWEHVKREGNIGSFVVDGVEYPIAILDL